ncbi:DUF4362 domain-containing protein [Actinoplanes sp. CA-030573]|uniref:DUF4362 domain-containing protein n=1 Tax=Actinoplanes sp. CA-030573 TaxID=3239898 RepID=UPI003D8E5899
MTRAVRLIFAVAVLAGCAHSGTTQAGPAATAGAPAGAVSAGAVSAGAPADTDCGTFTLDQGQEFPRDAARCLVGAANDNRGAYLRVTRPSTEGDPIPMTYRAMADGRVEVVTDTRQDQFGPQRITRELCSAPAVTDAGIEFAGCD